MPEMKSDETKMGGTKRTFQTTLWTDIWNAGSGNDATRQSSLENLLKRYWKPVYCYLRRKGHDNEQAKDLTQGFFQVVLDRKLIQRADRSQGRFRTFLLTALDRYLISVHRNKSARKRIPEHKFVQLDQVDLAALSVPTENLTPEESFNYTWVSSLLDQILTDVEAECRSRDMKIHWKVFNDRILQPIIEDTAAAPLSDICRKYGIDSEARASNMIYTVKRRFQAALKRHLRQSVSSEAEVGEELEEIMQFFAKNLAI